MVVRELLAWGAAKVGGNAALALAAPLAEAARRGHVDAATALLAAGASVEAQDPLGNTPLILASWKGHVEVGWAPPPPFPPWLLSLLLRVCTLFLPRWGQVSARS